MPTQKNIKTPETLYKHFEDYKIAAKNKVIIENVLAQKTAEVVPVQRERPLTWAGFETYLFKKKILVRLDDYKTNKEGRYAEYADIVHAIGREIFEDKYSGASVGIFSHNIIARDLGLHDVQKIDHTTKGKEINPGKTIVEFHDFSKKDSDEK
jgi:hypothetical protein